MSESEGYQLVRKIGAGISGPVYLSDNPSVAMRQFMTAATPGSVEAEADRLHFLDGARKTATLDDPRIVRTLEVIDEEGEAFVAVDHVPGETLESAMASRTIPPEEANYLLRSAAFALDYAHRKGVVHGDLKPSNIFLAPECGVRISDFAISPRARRDRGPVPPEWRHPYLSPEHLTAPETLGPASDQYSLAAIGYRLYTGEAPRVGVASGLRSLIASGRGPFSAATGAVFIRALSQNPQHRYGSSAEFVDALETTTAGAAPLPAPVKAQSRTWYIETGVALLLLIIAAWWVTAGRKSKSPPTAQQVAATSAPAPVSAPVSAPPQATPIPSVEPAARVASSNSPAVLKRDPTVTPPAVPSPVAMSSSPSSARVVTPQVAPAAPPPRAPAMRESRTALEPANVAQAGALDITVYSRSKKLESGISFGFRDPVLGEMGHGDLKAMVSSPGVPPKGKLTLEWIVDDVPMDSKPVILNRVVDYNNEPTTGMYRVNLKVDGRTVKTFVFRIAP